MNLVVLLPTASSVNAEIMDTLEDIAEGCSSPLSSSVGSGSDNNILVPFL